MPAGQDTATPPCSHSHRNSSHAKLLAAHQTSWPQLPVRAQQGWGALQTQPDTTLCQAPPLWIGLLRNSTSSRVVLMLPYLCSSSCSHVPKHRSTGLKPCRIHLCSPAWVPEHPAVSHSLWVLPPDPWHIQPQCGLTAHNHCAHSPKTTPFSLHSEGRYFLHISHNSADGQSLSRLFLPSGQKSHVTSALQKSNPSQCGEYPHKMWTWGLVFQLSNFPGELGGWSEKPPICSSDLQAVNTPRVAPAPLSSSPPTHSTNFNYGNRCGNKQVRQR